MYSILFFVALWRSVRCLSSTNFCYGVGSVGVKYLFVKPLVGFEDVFLVVVRYSVSFLKHSLISRYHDEGLEKARQFEFMRVNWMSPQKTWKANRVYIIKFLVYLYVLCWLSVVRLYSMHWNKWEFQKLNIIPSIFLAGFM